VGSYKEKLVPDAKNWLSWWSVRLSLAGGFLLTMLEAFPNAVSTIINVLPSVVTEQVGDDILKVIGIVCIVASPIARVIKQSRLDNANDKATND
jgi:preprotein translocase subunit SecY